MIVLNKETRGAASKDFTLNPKGVNGGLCLGYITDMEITTTEPIKADSSLRTFANKSLPRLAIHFKEHTANANDEPGIYTHAFLPIDPTQNHVEMWEKAMGSYLVHYTDTFGIDRSNLNITGVDDKGQPVDDKTADADTLISAWRRFFETYIALFKKGEIALYKDVLLYIKLLRYNNGNEVNKGRPGFPTFVGTGVIERWQKDKTPSITISKARGEIVEERERVVASPTPLPSVDNGQIITPSFLQ